MAGLAVFAIESYSSNSIVFDKKKISSHAYSCMRKTRLVSSKFALGTCYEPSKYILRIADEDKLVRDIEVSQTEFDDYKIGMTFR